MQIKVWLLGISPMVWRRMLVPDACTLRGLHGVIQVGMGWKGIHLYQFRLRSRCYGSWEVSASSPDVTLAALKLRRGARFMYEYDLNIPWWHEVRIEGNQLDAEPGKALPRCVAGDGACPPEDCGGPENFMTACDDRFSLDALEDLNTMMEIFSGLPPGTDRTSCRMFSIKTLACAWKRLWGGQRRAKQLRGNRFRSARSTPGFARANTLTSCTSSIDLNVLDFAPITRLRG